MIKYIIFDFGGILLDLDYRATDRAFSELFGIDVGDDRIYPDDMQQLLDDYEMGLMSEGSWMHRLQRSVDHIVTERQILDSWNAMLLTLPKRRLDWILSLRDKYQIFLLSNTNHTHIQYVHRVMLPRIRVTDFEEMYFDKVYYSHQVHLRKPNKDIYQYVINDLSIDPSEALFIDDNKDNVAGAKGAGLQATWHDPSLEVMDMIQKYISRAH